MQIKFSSKYKPLFDILKGKYPEVDTVILTGGRGCFVADTKIQTQDGESSISDIKKGDIVYSYNEKTKKKELKKVTNTFIYDNKKLYSIKLKNGTNIKVTGNHKFYHNGCWVKIKDLLYLWYGNMETNTEMGG